MIAAEEWMKTLSPGGYKFNEVIQEEDSYRIQLNGDIYSKMNLRELERLQSKYSFVISYSELFSEIEKKKINNRYIFKDNGNQYILIVDFDTEKSATFVHLGNLRRDSLRYGPLREEVIFSSEEVYHFIKDIIEHSIKTHPNRLELLLRKEKVSSPHPWLFKKTKFGVEEK